MPLAWPQDYNIPITFTLRAAEKQPDEDFRAIVQLSMVKEDPMNPDLTGMLESVMGGGAKATSYSSQAMQQALSAGQLFNCFVDRSDENSCEAARTNPRCCYHQLASFSDLGSCREDCRQSSHLGGGVPQSCLAVCLQAMVVQVELQLNQNLTGGSAAVSAVFKQARLAQDYDNDFKFQFVDVVSQDEKPRYHRSSSDVALGSPITNKVDMGFWIKWVPVRKDQGPYLEVGRDAETKPFLVHDFQRHCFDCERMDQFGWLANEIKNPSLSGSFRPKYWYVTALKEGGDVEAGIECKNVIYSKYQDQKWLDAPCVDDHQCRNWCQRRSCLGRSCELDETHFNGSLKWLGMKTCQIKATESMPTYIILLMVLVGLIAVVGVGNLGLCIFYLGSIYPRKKRAEHRTVQAPDLHKPGEEVIVEDWEPQTIEEDQGAQAPLPMNLTGIPITVPYADEDVLRDIRSDSVYSSVLDQDQPDQDDLFDNPRHHRTTISSRSSPRVRSGTDISSVAF